MNSDNEKTEMSDAERRQHARVAFGCDPDDES